jgi:hypothetical protein
MPPQSNGAPTHRFYLPGILRQRKFVEFAVQVKVNSPGEVETEELVMALPASHPCGQPAPECAGRTNLRPDCRQGDVPTQGAALGTAEARSTKPARFPWRGAAVALVVGGLLWWGAAAGLAALVLGAFHWRGASSRPAAPPSLADGEVSLQADGNSPPLEAAEAAPPAAAEAARPQGAAVPAPAPSGPRRGSSTSARRRTPLPSPPVRRRRASPPSPPRPPRRRPPPPSSASATPRKRTCASSWRRHRTSGWTATAGRS